MRLDKEYIEQLKLIDNDINAVGDTVTSKGYNKHQRRDTIDIDIRLIHLRYSYLVEKGYNRYDVQKKIPYASIEEMYNSLGNQRKFMFFIDLADLFEMVPNQSDLEELAEPYEETIYVRNHALSISARGVDKERYFNITKAGLILTSFGKQLKLFDEIEYPIDLNYPGIGEWVEDTFENFVSMCVELYREEIK